MFKHIFSNSRGPSPAANTRGSRLAARIALGVGLAVGGALICGAAEPQRDVDGLVRVHNQGVDHLYVLPEADFANYSKVRLDPVDVSFSERWNPSSSRRSAASRPLTSRDVQNLKSTVASEFERTVANVLMMSGYTLVDEDGEGVLRVTPMIVNLYITQPSQATRGGARVFVANTGHMTLVAVARDSITGEILARVIDTQRGRRTGRLELATSTSNMADARSAFTQWANILRTGLDDARKYPINASAPEKQASKEESGTPR